MTLMCCCVYCPKVFGACIQYAHNILRVQDFVVSQFRGSAHHMTVWLGNDCALLLLRQTALL